jgi:hypothetical protein
MRQYLIAIIRYLCIFIISQGIVLWLHGRGIWPEKWVANLLGWAATPANIIPLGIVLIAVSALVVSVALEVYGMPRLRRLFQRHEVQPALAGAISELTQYLRRTDTSTQEPSEKYSSASLQMRIADALDIIVEHFRPEWGEERVPGNFVIQAAARLREAAARGQIQIEGRKEINRDNPIGQRYSEIWTTIEKNYWETHEFDLGVVLAADADWQGCETRPENPTDASAAMKPGYAGLRIDKHEVQSLWPIANPWIKISDPIEDHHPWQASSSAKAGRRYWSIEVVNKSTATLTNCRLTDHKFVNYYGREAPHAGRPFRLKNERDSVEAHSRKFTLQGRGDKVGIDICSMDETNPRAPVVMSYAVTSLNSIDRKAFPHWLTLRFTADDIQPTDRMFKIYISDDGFLVMQAAWDKPPPPSRPEDINIDFNTAGEPEVSVRAKDDR